MKKIILSGLLVTITSFLLAQKANDVINAKEAGRILGTLASDEMRGRKTFSPEIDKAADFIAAEFKAAGLQTWDGGKSYRQEFSVVTAKQINLTATFDGQPADAKNIVAVTFQPQLKIDQSSGYETVSLQKGANLFREASEMAKKGKNLIVWIDTSFTKNFPRLSFLKRNAFKTDKNVIFVLTDKIPAAYTIEATHELTE